MKRRMRAATCQTPWRLLLPLLQLLRGLAARALRALGGEQLKKGGKTWRSGWVWPRSANPSKRWGAPCCARVVCVVRMLCVLWEWVHGVALGLASRCAALCKGGWSTPTHAGYVCACAGALWGNPAAGPAPQFPGWDRGWAGRARPSACSALISTWGSAWCGSFACCPASARSGGGGPMIQMASGQTVPFEKASGQTVPFDPKGGKWTNSAFWKGKWTNSAFWKGKWTNSAFWPKVASGQTVPFEKASGQTVPFEKASGQTVPFDPKGGKWTNSAFWNGKSGQTVPFDPKGGKWTNSAFWNGKWTNGAFWNGKWTNSAFWNGKWTNSAFWNGKWTNSAFWPKRWQVDKQCLLKWQKWTNGAFWPKRWQVDKRCLLTQKVAPFPPLMWGVGSMLVAHVVFPFFSHSKRVWARVSIRMYGICWGACWWVAPLTARVQVCMCYTKAACVAQLLCVMKLPWWSQTCARWSVCVVNYLKPGTLQSPLDASWSRWLKWRAGEDGL